MDERTEPMKFVVSGFELHAVEGDKRTWAVLASWSDEDSCFVMDSSTPGNYDFAPVDLEEIARILRMMPRDPQEHTP